jgi:hypothetical protein
MNSNYEGNGLIKDFVDEFARYRIGEKAIHQVSGEELNSVLGTDNSNMNPTKEKKPT